MRSRDADDLSPADAQAVFAWISLNADALVAYRDGQIDTARLIYRLQPIPGQPPNDAGGFISDRVGWRFAGYDR